MLMPVQERYQSVHICEFLLFWLQYIPASVVKTNRVQPPDINIYQTFLFFYDLEAFAQCLNLLYDQPLHSLSPIGCLGKQEAAEFTKCRVRNARMHPQA